MTNPDDRASGQGDNADPSDADAADIDFQIACDKMEPEHQWIKSAVITLQDLNDIVITGERPLAARVRFALDMAMIAAAERITRTMDADLYVEEEATDGGTVPGC